MAKALAIIAPIIAVLALLFAICTAIFYALLSTVGPGGVEVLGALVVIVVVGFVVVRVGSGLHLWMAERRARIRIVIAEAQHAETAAQFVWADSRGLLPVSPALLQSIEGSIGAMEIARLGQDVQRQVPRSLSWNVRNDHDVNAAGNVGLLPDKQVMTPPGFWQLYQGGQLPTDGFLMGYDMDEGGIVTADWRKLYSALIGGQSGSGKSTLIRSILAQSAMQGGRFVVIDLHYGAGDESLGESLQPLRHLMLCDVASSDNQMIDALAYVNSIGTRRLRGEDVDKSPVILVVDETTAMLQRSAVSDPLTNVLGQIAQETRKVGVYAMCIGQNFNGRIMDTTVRDSFVSFISCRARKGVARTMTDNNDFGKMAQDLSIGQAVWMSPGGEVRRLAVPNCTETDLDLIARHLGSKTGAIAAKPSLPLVSSASQSTSLAASQSTSLGAKEQRILDMIASGKSTSEIIRELYGVKGGKKYSEAASEVGKVMQHIAAKALGGH